VLLVVSGFKFFVFLCNNSVVGKLPCNEGKCWPVYWAEQEDNPRLFSLRRSSVMKVYLGDWIYKNFTLFISITRLEVDTFIL
jgi:hypothetical protein